MNMSKVKIGLTVAILLLGIFANSHAQKSKSQVPNVKYITEQSGVLGFPREQFGIVLIAQEDRSAKKWALLFEPYVMLLGMKGDIGLGPLPDAEVDEGLNLQFGARLYFEYNAQWANLWAITSDFVYMNFETDTKEGPIVSSGEADIEQVGWELAILRKFMPWLEAGIGGQLNAIDSELQLTIDTPLGPQEGGAIGKQTWFDPTIIGRINYPFRNQWLFQFRGNIGGFGLGSDFAWQIQTYITYQVSSLSELSAGYRWISVDYEGGEGLDRFMYDIDTFGAALRFGFNF